MPQSPSPLSAEVTVAPYRHSKLYAFYAASIVGLFGILLSSYRYFLLHRLFGAYGIKSVCRQAQRYQLWATNHIFFECSPFFLYHFIYLSPRSSSHTCLNNTLSLLLFNICFMPSITVGSPVQSICYDAGDGEIFPGRLKS